MGCNCGDNEYNITVDNNGNCEPTTPIYNITLANVGVNGYSPIVRFVNETIDSFNIAVDNVTGTETSPAVPKLSYVTDQIDNINNTIANLGDTYLTVNGSNASSSFTINNLSIKAFGSGTKLGEEGDLYVLALQAKDIRLQNYDYTNSLLAGIQLSNGNVNITTNGIARYNSHEIATVNNIPTKTSDLTNDSGFITNSDIPTVGNGTITINQNGVTKGTFTTNQSGNTTIELDEGGGVTNPLTITDEGSNNFLQFIVNDSGSYIRTGTQGLSFNGYLINTVDNPLSLDDVAFGLKAINLKYDNDTIKVNQDGQLYADVQGGTTYTAGTGIDITNDTISVDNTVAMKTDIPTNNNQLTNGAGYITSSALNGYATENFVTSQGYITGITSSDVTTALGYTPYNSTNPNGYITASALNGYAKTTDLATVATSGSYNDLTDKPTIPAAQVQADWNETNTSSKAYILNKPTIPAGVVVDQTFDGTSQNAQSGVAISNAKFIQNTATETNSLTILGTASNHLNSINIGVGSTVHGQYATVIGYNANGSDVYATAIGYDASCGPYSTAIGYNARGGDYSTAIGYNAKALSNNSAIQIGYGTNTTANTLSVGFYNSSSKQYNWRLLDGTTGLIPDARISTNIARTSQIPTNISALINDSGYITNSALNGYATQTWVGQQGYLTSSALTNYVTNTSLATTLADYVTNSTLTTTLADYQPLLVSGTNIKTINNTSLLGSGNIDVLTNTASRNTSLTIGDNASTLSYTTNVGIGSQATATAGQAFGHYAIAGGQYSLALGQGAEASSNYAIQLGKGTNATATTLSVGFGNNGNYQLLDGSTGLIPDARLSSNIARTNDIPDISNLANTDLSNLSTTGQAVIDGKVSKSGDTMTGALNLDMTTVGSSNENFQDITFTLDDINRAGIRCSHSTDGKNSVQIITRNNSGALAVGYTQTNNNGTLSCSFPDTTCCDGQWVAKYLSVFSGVSAIGNGDYSISSYLPNDGHVYEVLACMQMNDDGTTSGSDSAAAVGNVAKPVDNNCFRIYGNSDKGIWKPRFNGILVFLGNQRKVYYQITGRALQNGLSLQFFGYRRIGTNS